MAIGWRHRELKMRYTNNLKIFFSNGSSSQMIIVCNSYIQLAFYYYYFNSENYIFGKFDAFCKRIEKLEDMLSTIHKLSKLPDVRIEVYII